jgi:eukaryotic-like serine/threonine-protein kinase
VRHFQALLCPSCDADAGDVSKFCPSCGAVVARASGSDDYVGTIVAKKYRVEQMIGEGGMGKVYRAKQLALDKPVVLKVLRHTLLSDERTVARFQREARAASRLNHPNSISVLDFGQNEDGAMYIAMELVTGKDLHHILSREWPLPEPRLVRIITQVLSALSDAHGAGVIHRDLKPENIMVEQRRNEPDFVKVLDFGIAKIQDSGNDEGPALTRAGFVCGTPEYMSPEQARGSTLDHRSDLYAVGVILYQLTTGVLPFESDSAVGFATKHLTEEPSPPSKKRPDARISPAMGRLILRALSKSPNDRPQTAEEFKQELLSVERDPRGAPGITKRPTLSPPLQPLPRRLTPPDQAATSVQEDAWGTESTVRAMPMPLNPRASPTSETGAPDTGGMVWFKVITVGLVLTALSVTGVYVYQQRAHGTSEAEPFIVPSNAPLPTTAATTSTAGGAERPSGASDALPLFEVQVPVAQRDRTESTRLAREGDQAYRAGNLGLAATRYKEAFEKDPSPELSLKLGEVHYQRNQTQEAKGWWRRHLKDQADSKARRYIQQAFSELATQ